MQIIDTVPYFFTNFESTTQSLRKYYAEFPEIFKEYFNRHCKDTEERHLKSIEKYPQYFNTIKEVHENIHLIIHEIAEAYKNKYNISFPVDINLIVGGFGSNAYTYRQIIPNITFALEKLSPLSDHLHVIVAHEFGHLAQNILSDNAGMNWSKTQWTHPLIWLYREGIATDLSRQITANINPSVYFSYNDEGDDWLDFAQANTSKIRQAFKEDYETLTSDELFYEWFSINGGRKFGYSRLAYFLGDLFVQEYKEGHGELATIIAWKDHNFEAKIANWLAHEGAEIND
ncbi:hypothetical protein SAMN05518871_102505 [Psychrobacillus sp. OK028]|uniref:hypothetical protein n=1 Tax=Psychrobacillus sp. OK028 TaxID=1884359 RepID=UPI00088491A6|nr:hypothetical protein [Psychrobacillus sp. OK028]SDM89563.1 hypothetical protein SAMN05518871_102505 [Psychrobacillus sp. OK028]